MEGRLREDWDPVLQSFTRKHHGEVISEMNLAASVANVALSARVFGLREGNKEATQFSRGTRGLDENKNRGHGVVYCCLDWTPGAWSDFPRAGTVAEIPNPSAANIYDACCSDEIGDVVPRRAHENIHTRGIHEKWKGMIVFRLIPEKEIRRGK